MLFVSYEELQQHINHNCNIPSSALDDVVKYEFAFSCDPENADYCKKRGCQDFCHHTLNPEAAKNFDLISDQPTRKKYFENQKSGWIPCSERLPRYNEYVLVYRPEMAIKIIVDCYDEGWTYSKDDAVVAWMPLPAPYKKEGDPGVDIPSEEKRS